MQIREQKHRFSDGNSKHKYNIDIISDHEIMSIDEDRSTDRWRGVWFTDFYEIYMCLTDGVNMIVNDRTYHLKKYDLLIFNTLDFHRILNWQGETLERINLVFSLSAITSISTANTDLSIPFTKRGNSFNHLRHQTEEQGEWMLSRMQEITKWNDSAQYGKDVRKKMLLADILLYLHDRYCMEELDFTPIEPNSYRRVIPILNYINDNIREDLSLDLLAKQFYINKFYLCHVFKEMTGHTVKEYVTFRRIMRAAELLHEGHTIRHICEQIGMKSEDYFSTLFKKITGMTPRKYAEQFRMN